MAWTIRAGSDWGMSLESNDKTGACGWRLSMTKDHFLPGHPPVAPHAAKQVWQEVLVQLTA